MKKNVKALLMVALFIGVASVSHAERFFYLDEATYLSDLAALGSSTFQEGFEDDGAWGTVRSTISGGTNTAPIITSMGISWTPNNPNSEITTGQGPARTGLWGFYELPHGDFGNGVTDGWIGTSQDPLWGVGGWIETNTPFAEVEMILDGDTLNLVDFGDHLVTTQHQFFGVIDTNGFTTFEVREIEGTLEDQKFIFSDDYTFGLPGSTVCEDVDQDGYGDPASPVCAFPELDCDDTDPNVNPGSQEVCDEAGVDEDCDGLIDGEDPDCAYPGAANAQASTFGSNSLSGSGAFNGLALVLVPIGAVILLRCFRRKK